MKIKSLRTWSSALLMAALCCWSIETYAQGADCSTAEAVGVVAQVASIGKIEMEAIGAVGAGVSFGNPGTLSVVLSKACRG